MLAGGCVSYIRDDATGRVYRTRTIDLVGEGAAAWGTEARFTDLDTGEPVTIRGSYRVFSSDPRDDD